jgi:hypothetical protein
VARAGARWSGQTFGELASHQLDQRLKPAQRAHHHRQADQFAVAVLSQHVDALDVAAHLIGQQVVEQRRVTRRDYGMPGTHGGRLIRHRSTQPEPMKNGKYLRALDSAQQTGLRRLAACRDAGE